MKRKLESEFLRSGARFAKSGELLMKKQRLDGRKVNEIEKAFTKHHAGGKRNVR